MKIKAAVLREAGRSRPYCDSKLLQIEEVDLDPPNRGEVLVLSQSFFGHGNGRVLDKFMRPSWKTV